MRIARQDLTVPNGEHQHAARNAGHQPDIPKVEQQQGVRIITFTAGKDRNMEDVVGRELAGLTENLDGCHLLLDFTNVDRITSVELGTLVNLHNTIKHSGGRLTLFNLSSDVFEVFAVTRLQTLISICR
jgi:anti-anti-sigma factor